MPYVLNPIVFDIALRKTTVLALTAYPTDKKRIERGAQLVRDGHVTFEENGHTALVRSGSNPDRVYHSNGSCECIGFTYAKNGRCSHRYAKSLLRKARTLYETMIGNTWYAAYADMHGIAYKGDDHYVFFGDNGEEKIVVWNNPSLMLFGNCAIADAQKAEDMTQSLGWV